jgi:DNA-binding transcriptional ArsR family regulator
MYNSRVPSASYRTALDAAIKEYERLGEERRATDRRLAELAQTIGTLSRLLGLVPTVPLGLTEACRLVLRSGTPMTPVEVRDQLLGIGMDLSIYSNDLSAIHTVLKRLTEGGAVRLVRQPSGKRAYLWQAPPITVPISREMAEHIRESGTFHVRPPARRKGTP